MSEKTKNPIKGSSLQTIKDGLFSETAIVRFQDSLPQAVGKTARETAERFAKNVYTHICQNPDLQMCTLESIIRASCLSASLNLDIDPRGLAYLVPYYNNKVKPPQREAQFQIGYLGLIELAYRSNKVLDISAHCIYESEKDSVKITRVDGRYKVEHPFSYNEPKGKMIVVYATAEVEGFGPRSIVLRKDEVEAARKFSKAPNSPAWTNHYPMMAKKTAIRQLAKFLPKSILEEFSKGVAIDEQETFVEASQAAQQRIEGDMGSEPVDVQFEEDKKENDKHKLPANKDHDGKKEATEHSEPATPPANNKKSKPVLDVKYQCTYSVGCGKMYYGTKDGVIYGGDGKELGKDSTGNYLCTDCGYTVERCKNKDEAM